MITRACLVLAVCIHGAFSFNLPRRRSNYLLTSRPTPPYAPPATTPNSLPSRLLAVKESSSGKARVRQSRGDNLALAAGAVLLAVLVANRLAVPPEKLYDSQSRTDLLGVAAIAGLVLNSLSSLDVTSRDADAVVLEGVRGRGLSPAIQPGGSLSGAFEVSTWALEGLLANTPAATAVLVWRGIVLVRQGMIPRAPLSPEAAAAAAVGSGPIARQAKEERKPLYLASLQALPGRVEFTSSPGGGPGVLPPNSQSLVVVAVGSHGTLLLAADRARAFAPEDLAAALALAQPLARALEAADGK